MNPFTLVDEKPYPLDMRGELDDTATFKNFKKCGNIEFPMPFGRTSASLKLTVLNPKGRIRTMGAGGSAIYADTVRDLALGMHPSLGNMQNTVMLLMKKRCCNLPELLLD